MASGTLVLFILSVAAALVDGNSEGDILHNWRTLLNDPNNVLQSWDPTLVNPCTWFHVTCNFNNSVTRVDLGNAGLSGEISPLLGNLTNLRYLELYGNSFNGKIPASIVELTSLVSLDLSRNQLSGSVPPNFHNLKSLRFLDLYKNNLTGEIPPEIGKLTSLTRLNLNNNQFSGSIPHTIGNLKALRFLRLNGNALSGDLPVEVLDLVRGGHLNVLNVSENFLTGSDTTRKSRDFAITTIIQDPRV